MSSTLSNSHLCSLRRRYHHLLPTVSLVYSQNLTTARSSLGGIPLFSPNPIPRKTQTPSPCRLSLRIQLDPTSASHSLSSNRYCETSELPRTAWTLSILSLPRLCSSSLSDVVRPRRRRLRSRGISLRQFHSSIALNLDSLRF